MKSEVSLTPTLVRATVDYASGCYHLLFQFLNRINLNEPERLLSQTAPTLVSLSGEQSYLVAVSAQGYTNQISVIERLVHHRAVTGVTRDTRLPATRHHTKACRPSGACSDRILYDSRQSGRMRA